MEHLIGIARYYDNKIEWDNSPTNELRGIESNKNTPCAVQYKKNTFGKYVPVCCSFKPKQNEKIWKEELDWDSKTTGDKIRTIVSYNDDTIQNEIIDILSKRRDVKIVAVTKSPEDTYNKIVECKPEMVFTKYNIDIIKKSKEKLADGIPIFNIIEQNGITENDVKETRQIIGKKLNTIISGELTQKSRYDSIIENYKEYINTFAKL